MNGLKFLSKLILGYNVVGWFLVVIFFVFLKLFIFLLCCRYTFNSLNIFNCLFDNGVGLHIHSPSPIFNNGDNNIC